MSSSSPDVRCTCRHHQPAHRVVVDYLGGWEMRVYAKNSAVHRERSARGELHLQLFFRELGVSVLTRSALTDGKFEILHKRNRYRTSSWDGVQRVLGTLPLPTAKWVTENEVFYVHLSMLGCLPKGLLGLSTGTTAQDQAIA